MTQPIQIITATGAHAFQVEIAADDASRARGLAGRQSMPPDHGMLFEFDREEPRAFNMINTHIPLDVIFLSQAGASQPTPSRSPRMSPPTGHAWRCWS